MNIFLTPVVRELESGLSELEFRLFGGSDLLFRPTVLIYKRSQVKKKGNEDVARNGVCVLFDNQKNADNQFGVAVEQPIVNSKNAVKATMQGQPNLMEYIHQLAQNSEPQELPNWKTAILICDWEKDIWGGTEKSRNQASKYRKSAINDIMAKEVSHLSKILRKELKDSKDLNLNVVGESKENYFLPNPDSLRYEYYVDIVKEALRMNT